MTEAVIVALVSGGLTLAGVILTNNKVQAEADTRQEERIKSLNERFDERMAESNRRLDELTASVKEHNNYAHRLPVLEEKVEGMDKRLTKLEERE